MARYLVVLGLIALAVGALFRGANTLHIPLLKMAGTIGILLFGVGGTLALQRWQGTSGRKQIETALTSLGPEFIITDWSEGNGPRGSPDYLVVAPAGLISITVDEMPNGGSGRRVAARIARARERALREAEWVRQHLTGFGPRPVPLQPLLVLSRRQATPDDSAPDCPVLNPEHLRKRVLELAQPETLEEKMRLRITLVLRREAAAARR